MFKVFVFLSALFFSCNADKYRGVSCKKLDNGISVIFIDTVPADSLLVMLCISSGSTDEIQKTGIANLLKQICEKKLKERSLNKFECDSYVGYDQSAYYFYGKSSELSNILKNLGAVISDISFLERDLTSCKKIVEKKILDERQIDKNIIRSEARKCLYWHSNYGNRTLGNINDLQSISETDLAIFKNNNYTTDRMTLIIAGNVNKKLAQEEILKLFHKSQSSICRLEEPPHHGSVTKIIKNSPQVSVPIVEMYWKIPNYRTQKREALAAEIFINHLDEALQKSLIDTQKIITSMSFNYSFWNYDYGDFCITFTTKNSGSVDDVITAVLAEIKSIVSDEISESQAKKAAKKLSTASNVFRYDVDVVNLVDWLSKRVAFCDDFEFLKTFSDFVNKFDLKEINTQSKEIFKNDPIVISIMKPIENKSAI